MDEYGRFLERKAQFSGMSGFNPVFMPDMAFDFQKSLIEWSVNKGRGAELKETYFEQTIRNLDAMDFSFVEDQQTLFDGEPMFEETVDME